MKKKNRTTIAVLSFFCLHLWLIRVHTAKLFILIQKLKMFSRHAEKLNKIASFEEITRCRPCRCCIIIPLRLPQILCERSRHYLFRYPPLSFLFAARNLRMNLFAYQYPWFARRFAVSLRLSQFAW